MFPEVGRATVTLLERLGHEVAFPADQTCCGQMHLNSGYAVEADRLAHRFQRVFAGFDAVVSPSSSCAGTMREHYGLENVHELSSFLVDVLGDVDVGARFPHRVAYHPTCHSLRVTRVGDAPYRLLECVDQLELVEIGRSRECCGFGGTFAVKNPDISSAMLADKCDDIEATGPDYCAALDSSCLLHIGGGLSRRKSAVRTIHLAEILSRT
jgi:L-lactate dehydrogenase complex protein LldE